MTKDELKAFARQCGFDAVGVAPPMPRTGEAFTGWLAQGCHGEMGYLERHAGLRRDPELLFPAVRRVLVLAQSYRTEDPPHSSPEKPFQSVISRYAWGRDYHNILRQGLRKIVDFIHERTQGAHQARACVDTAPVLERDFAAQAGIGWIGKHTNLLSRQQGNWLFLGVILTSLELEPDHTVKSHCGTCARCLEACPTRAFLSPYVLDARRCISYLTIELKGPIPRELRRAVGQRIFGCDDCLAVCPWNRFAARSSELDFYPRHRLLTTTLVEWMTLTPEKFRARFQGSPILRAKRRGFLRNVAVALGNTRDARAVPVLANALRDPEPLIRGHAAWALGEIGGKTALRELVEARRGEEEPYVRDEIETALREGCTVSGETDHFLRAGDSNSGVSASLDLSSSGNERLASC
ncbi:MAG: tRNA epoxyqueuosine(34) reductase QueG [bacterium]